MLNRKTFDLIPVIRHYFQDKPVLKAWLFGSYSRGEETPSSDIDILVDYDESEGVVSLLKIGGMLMELSRLLGVRVDLVESEGLMEFARASVERDKILIYEREN